MLRSAQIRILANPYKISNVAVNFKQCNKVHCITFDNKQLQSTIQKLKKLNQAVKSMSYGRARHSKNRMLAFNKKALAAIAEDCLSLRSKRVPQAQQVLYVFDTVGRIIFGGAKTFWLLFSYKK